MLGGTGLAVQDRPPSAAWCKLHTNRSSPVHFLIISAWTWTGTHPAGLTLPPAPHRAPTLPSPHAPAPPPPAPSAESGAGTRRQPGPEARPGTPGAGGSRARGAGPGPAAISQRPAGPRGGPGPGSGPAARAGARPGTARLGEEMAAVSVLQAPRGGFSFDNCAR